MATTIYKFQSDLTGLIALNKGLREANANLNMLGANSKKAGMLNAQAQTLNRTGNRMVGIFRSASIAIVSAFAFRAIIGGLKGIVTTFAKFEKQMAAVRAISGATDEQFKELTDSARKLGETTVFTATEVGKLQEEFARLGFDPHQILAAQAATLDLAAATGENLASAAAIAGSSLKAYGLEAEQIVRVTNVMGAAFTNSALNLERFTQSMKFAAPVAKTAGFTIEETSSMLMVLADAGLHGSIAGNALKNIFLRLGDANSKLNKHIGRTVQGLPQLIVEMEKMKAATFGLTDATQLLDKRSAPAFLVLLRNIDELKLKTDILNKAEGDITRMAAIRLDNLAGDFTLLKSATEGLGIAVGETFDFALRKSIQSLTDWVQNFTKSRKGVETLRKTFTGIGIVLKMLAYRFAILKGLTLINAALTFRWTARLRLLKIQMAGVRNGTITASTALKGFRTALASTGVGVLIVGLGMLIGYLMDVSDATEEAEYKLNRLRDAMNEDISATSLLSEQSSERHDKLREMVVTYKELLGNIDLEILNNEELIALQEILNETTVSGHQTASNNAKAEYDALLLKMALDKKASDDKIAQIKQQKKETVKMVSTGHGSPVQGSEQKEQIFVSVGTEEMVAKAKSDAQIIRDIDQAKLDAFQKTIDEHDILRDKAFKQQTEAAGLELGTANQTRNRLRLDYLKDLENFRSIKIFAKQKAIEKSQKQTLEDMKFAKEMADLQNQITAFQLAKNVEMEDKANELMVLKKAKATEASKKFFNDFMEDGAKMNIQISEFRKYVSNLSSTLEKSGGSFKKSALSGFRLNKTKKRLKELLDIQIKTINDVYEKELATADASFQAKREKYEREEELIVTNLNSITQLMEQSTDEQIRADIKANRTKYDVLKNLDQKEWDRFMKGKDVSHQEYLDLLQKMLDEEVAKQVINEDILVAIKKEYDNIQEQIIIENDKRLLDYENEKSVAELSKLNENLISFGSTQKAKLALAQKMHDDELAYLEKSLKTKAISQEKHDMLVAQSAEKLLQAKNDAEDAYLQKVSETYQQVAGMIMEASSNAAAFQIDDINKTHDWDVEQKQEAFDRKLEIAEAAGHDTTAMQQTHNDQMEALEDRKEQKIRVIKKKQFMIEKANAIIMAIINGAMAITKVSGQTGIGAIAAAPLMSALIAAQIGVIATKKFVGAKGGIIPGGDEKYADGGMVHGPSHEQGGVKFGVGGRVVELEGGEAVINKRSTAMFHGQLSEMNQAGGGKRFAEGGVTPGTRAMLDSAKDTWTAKDIASLISSSINSQQVYVTESDISSTQSVVNISEGLSTIFK